MKQNEPESLSYALSLIVKAAVLEARWAGSVRRMAAESSCRRSDDRGREILMLRERVRELESRNAILRQQLRRRQGRPRYTLRERLQIIWFMEYFQIPRRKVFETFGVARSSLYRWLRRIEDQASASVEPANKTLAEIANLVWEVARANVSWGRKRIAHQFRALKVFIAASTVRRILDR
ncbi:MAG: hypothetical protein JXR96_15620, partial [Deltaproteobacteria bacterium]|nr:hypothetical protein [Deltaproteobacteria bacterium]